MPLAERVVLELFRRFPPHSTIFMAPEGRAETEYDEERCFGFHRFFGLAEDLYRDRDVLDLGCGFGGRTVRFEELGARSVAGMEVDAAMVQHCRRFAAAHESSAIFAVGYGEALPYPDGSFDLILMNDVMEHVINPATVLAECDRVLRPGGRLLTVFPPYYDFSSGSHLHGYATRLPALNAVFRTRTLRAAARRRLDEQGIEWRPFLREASTDKLWNQNGLTVRGFNRLVAASALEPEQVWHLGHRDHRLLDESPRGARRLAYAAAELPARIPLLRELFCLRICAVLIKPDRAAPQG